jgi:hypothetical protein
MIVFPWFQIYEVLPPPLWLIDADVVGGLGGLGEDVKSIDDVGGGANDDDELEK